MSNENTTKMQLIENASEIRHRLQHAAEASLHKKMIGEKLDKSAESVVDAMRAATMGGKVLPYVLADKLSDVFESVDQDLFFNDKSLASGEQQFCRFVLSRYRQWCDNEAFRVSSDPDKALKQSVREYMAELDSVGLDVANPQRESLASAASRIFAGRL